MAKIMKKIISMVALLMFSMGSFGCDEECRKQAAAVKHNVKFASYLSSQYCDDIKSEFMTISIRSLQNYRDTRLNDKRSYGMKNTKNFINQRVDWLQECDQYLSLTDDRHVFHEEKTTNTIFAAMGSVSRELNALMNGASYAMESDVDAKTIIAEKFDHLFQLVDNHKTLMQLRGQVASRR
jgi:hypothetical protein